MGYTQEEADRIEAEFEALRTDDVFGSVTFEEYVVGFFWPAKTHIRENTRRGYKLDINLRLIPAFGRMDNHY